MQTILLCIVYFIALFHVDSYEFLPIFLKVACGSYISVIAPVSMKYYEGYGRNWLHV